MTAFLQQLRTAHTIFCAHARGTTSVSELARVTHLPVQVVAEWTRELRLPVSYATTELYKLPARETATFDSLNNEGA